MQVAGASQGSQRNSEGHMKGPVAARVPAAGGCQPQAAVSRRPLRGQLTGPPAVPM